MPRGDGTGPTSTGPITERATGYSTESPNPEFAGPVPQAGLGLREGFGNSHKRKHLKRFGGPEQGRRLKCRPTFYAPKAYRPPVYSHITITHNPIKNRLTGSIKLQNLLNRGDPNGTTRT